MANQTASEPSPLIAFDGKRETLSKCELEVAALVVLGLSNQEIADRRVTTVKTVKGHLTRIYLKLGVRNRYALIRTECSARADQMARRWLEESRSIVSLSSGARDAKRS